jgi:hypothetical protein
MPASSMTLIICRVELLQAAASSSQQSCQQAVSLQPYNDQTGATDLCGEGASIVFLTRHYQISH